MANAVVVGYGTSGKSFHCYLIELTDGLNLHGVVSSKEEKRREIVDEHGCEAFPTLEAALADAEVDLIVIATPNSTHAEIAIQAMDAGKNVVTDKVMCLSVAEFDRMVDAAGRNSVFLNCFQNRRWDGDYLTVQKLMEEGKFGGVRWLEMAWQGFNAWGGWRGNAEMGGGRLYDLGAHLIDQACMIFPGPLKSVYCRMHHDYDETDTESEALVVITFEEGQTAVCDVSSMAAIEKPRFYVRGPGGTYRKYGLDPQEAVMLDGDIDAAEEPEELYGTFSDGNNETTIATVNGRWRTYYENIRDVLHHDADPAVKLPELRRQISVIDAAFTSADSGQVVEL